MNPRLRAIASGVGLGVLGIGLGFGLVLVVGLSLALAGVEIGPLLSIGLSLILVQGIALMGVGYAYLRRQGIPLRSVGLRFPSLRELGVAAGAFVVSIIYLVVVSIVIQSLGAQTAENNVVSLGRQNPEILLLLIPGSYIFIGPGEELLFRGVIQTRIRDVFPPVSGVIIASIIFAGIHLPALSFGAPLSAKLTTLAVLMGPSLLLGASYEYTDNLVVPILIHGSYNALLFLGLYVQLTAGSSAAALL
ncbi:lysostaphin resistance A-like protein [Halolamina sp.]|uniref:CPBP family intramembrane glutamic endopeptidase n=1 Tax=Halolamina sp. TaxID=1940283 RepID=UPI00356204EF